MSLSFEPIASSKESDGTFDKSSTYPKPNDPAIKCLVASGRQTRGSAKEESVVSVVVAKGGVNNRWVFISRAGRSTELELSEAGGREEGESKEGAEEEGIQRHHIPWARLSGQLANKPK